MAPSARCCTVAGRCPTVSNISRRESARFTARPGTVRAASTVSTVPACREPLVPKPPPTCGDATSTSSSASPNSPATVSRAPATPCEDSWSTTWSSPSQQAIVACGSIGLWCCTGVV